MYEIDMPIRSMCLSGHRKFPFGSEDEDIRIKSMEIMEKAIKLADDLGIKIIQLAGYDVYYGEGNEITKRYFLENLIKATELASKYGITLGFETMETEFMNTVEKAMEYVNKVDSPYLGVYLDCGNITNAAKFYGTSEIDDLKKGKGHIVAVHLKETIPGHFREVPFGTGHVKFEEIIKTCLDLGVRRFVTEFWFNKDLDYNEDVRNTVKFFEEKFKKILK